MKKHITARNLGILFSIYFCGFLVYVNINKPRILILHSYNPDYEWTKGVNEGLKRVLDKKRFYTVEWHYMRTKSSTPEQKISAGNRAKIFIDRWNPDIIIAVDDNAQKYVAMDYLISKSERNSAANNGTTNIYPQIIFAGMNADLDEYKYDNALNVTGILERLEIESMKEVIEMLLEKPDAKIGLVTDISPTSKAVYEQVVCSQDWRPMQVVYSKRVDNKLEWTESIKDASSKADILLFTNYHTIKEKPVPGSKPANETTIDWCKNGKLVSSIKLDKNKKISTGSIRPTAKPAELIKIAMDTATVPGIGAWGFFVEHGGMLSVGTSPYEQGEVAASIAIDILKKIQKNPDFMASNIKFKKTEQFIMYINEARLKDGIQKFKLKRLTKVYEAFARATNNYKVQITSEQN